MSAGLRAGVAYVDVEGRLSRDFDSNIESEAGGKMTDLGGKLGTLLGAGLAGAGALAGAALTKGLFDAVSNEAGNDRLAAQLGISNPDYAADLGKIAGDLYANNFGGSVADANAALRAVLSEGLLPEDATNAQIESITGKVLNLSDVFEQDLGGTSQAVGQMLKTGMAKDATEALDIITRGFQQGADKRGDYLDTLNEYGTQFRKLGIDGATATGILSQGLKAGARDADLVADSLKEFAIRASDGSDLTVNSFNMLGLSGEAMTEKIARGGSDAREGLMETLTALKAMDDPLRRGQAAVGLFGTQAEDMGAALLAIDPSTAVQGLGDVAGAADKMGETIGSNTAAKIETFKRQALQGLADFMGNVAIPAIERFLPVVENVVGAVVEKWPEIQAAIMPVVEEIVAFVAEQWPQIEKTVKSVMESVSGIVRGVLELVQILWQKFGKYILEFVASTFSGMLKIIDGVMKFIQGVIDVVLGLITGDWGRVWTGIKEVLSGVWLAIQGVVEQAIARVRFIIQVGIEAVKTVLGGVLGAIAGLFSSAWDGIGRTVSGAWDWIKGTVRGGIDSVVDFVRGIAGRISSVARGMWDGISDAFRSALNTIIRGWNHLEFKIPGFSVGPVHFGGFTLGVPDIPFLAAGGDFSGLAIVGEDGPELLASGSRARVHSHADLLEMMSNVGASGTSKTYELNLHGPFGNDVVDVEEQFRRMEILAGSAA